MAVAEGVDGGDAVRRERGFGVGLARRWWSGFHAEVSANGLAKAAHGSLEIVSFKKRFASTSQKYIFLVTHSHTPHRPLHVTVRCHPSTLQTHDCG